MKSDIWSMAFVLAELYTGEMYFPTHENIEHLALIENHVVLSKTHGSK